MSVAFLLLAVLASGATNTQWSCRLPVLTVKNSSGSLVYVKISYSREPESREPLTIAISEQLPQSSGDALRASIWQAAMVAALEKKDPLQGVSLQFTVPGLIDGPSAGCAFTLAIMSAIDGLPFPTNIVATGSILPDGTIGRVGGLHYKIMAARNAGINQIIIPDYLRFEIDAEKQITVDVKQLASVLGLKTIPVTTISEAYARLHGKMPAFSRRVDDKINMPYAADRYFLRQYERYRHYLSFVFSEYPDIVAESNDFAGCVSDTLAYANRADQAASMDYLDLAVNYMRHAVSRLNGHIQTLSDVADEEVMNSLGDILPQRLGTMQAPLDMVKAAQAEGLSVGGIQFLADIAEGRALADYLGVLGSVRDLQAEVVGEAKDSELMSAEELEAAEDDLLIYQFQFHVGVNIISDIFINYVTNIVELDKSLSYPYGYKLKQAGGIENLFYSTYLASQSTLSYSMSSFCEDMGIDPNVLYIEAIMQYPEMSAAFNNYPSEGREEVLGRDDLDQEFLKAALSLSYIGSIAQSARFVMSVIELDPAFDEFGNITYSRTGLLHQLLRIARKRALDSVLTCKERGLPWLSAAIVFRGADFLRDDPTVDKTEVLAGYWQASLQANAIMLMLEPDKNTRIPVRQPLSYGACITEVLSDCQPAIKVLKPGDVITHIDGVRIKNMDESLGIVAAMPNKKKYEIRYVAAADRKEHTVTVVGGKLLGIMMQDAYPEQ